jgi:hypothetical protein
MKKASLTLVFIIFFAYLKLQVQATPQLSVTILAPQNGSYTYPDFELRWSISGKANRTEIYVDGKAIKTDLEPSKDYYYMLDLMNGTRKILVRAVGFNNESAEDVITVTVLTALTKAKLIYPNEGFVTNSSFVNVTWNATGPIKSIIFWSNELHETISLNKDQRNYNLTLQTQGKVEVKVSFVDLRGPKIVEMVSFIHDSVPPLVKINSPKDAQTLDRSFVLVRWECLENVSIIRRSEMYLDGILFSNQTEGEKYLTELSDGEHLLKLLAIDAAGNKGEVLIRFFVSVPFWARYGMIVYLLIIVGVGFVLLIYIKRLV